MTFTTTKVAGRDESFLDLSLILPRGALVGKRVQLSQASLAELLRSLYSQVARQEPLGEQNPAAPARRLYDLLIRPLKADLDAAEVTTLLLSVDSGLQALPFAVLHDGQNFFGARYGFSLTPTLGLMPLDVPSQQVKGGQLLAGSAVFDGLAPLPLVPQELGQIESVRHGEDYLNKQFTPDMLLKRLADPAVKYVHAATHAEFLPGGPSRSRLYTGVGPMTLSQFAGMRQRRQGQPLELIVLSACRTALGDKDSELGFAGLALQAGARSAIGTLWYVDDVATSGFFVLFYRYLEAGYPKAEALQMTRRDFASGAVRLSADRLVAGDGQVLLKDLDALQQRRLAAGLTHPYFWGGIELLGTPW
jgi:CHAT domain-containing protein